MYSQKAVSPVFQEAAMRATRFGCYLLTGCIGILCLCGKNNKQELRYGPDSLDAKKMHALMSPDTSASDSARIRQTLFRYALAKTFSEHPAHLDSASIKLARRLTLQSGSEWSTEAASLLLSAANALEIRIRREKEIAPVIVFVESVFTAIELPSASGKGPHVLRNDFAGLDTLRPGDEAGFKKIVGTVFGVTSEEAATIANFVRQAPRTTKDSAAAVAGVDKMVRGMLSKAPSAGTAVPIVTRENTEQEREKSGKALLALRYRSQESIIDSIAAHLPGLRLIYKKQLKLNAMSGGKVWVVFIVDAEGGVLSARVKSSEIANKQFQQLLEEYVRTIHFKNIPKEMEPMVFEFPFEFKSEE